MKSHSLHHVGIVSATVRGRGPFRPGLGETARLSYLIAMLPFDSALYDLDETPLDSRKRISVRTRRSLETAREAGLHVIFATTRSQRDIRHPGLEEFGARVYYNGDSRIARAAIKEKLEENR